MADGCAAILHNLGSLYEKYEMRCRDEYFMREETAAVYRGLGAPQDFLGTWVPTSLRGCLRKAASPPEPPSLRCHSRGGTHVAASSSRLLLLANPPPPDQGLP